jgi:hypothetical protein
MFHDFAVGAEITDQSMIEWLQSLNAPVEKIFEGEFRR